MNACAEEYTDKDNSTQGVYPSGGILSIMHTALWETSTEKEGNSIYWDEWLFLKAKGRVKRNIGKLCPINMKYIIHSRCALKEFEIVEEKKPWNLDQNLIMFTDL